jgi:hypothetical protein
VADSAHKVRATKLVERMMAGIWWEEKVVKRSRAKSMKGCNGLDALMPCMRGLS